MPKVIRMISTSLRSTFFLTFIILSNFGATVVLGQTEPIEIDPYGYSGAFTDDTRLDKVKSTTKRVMGSPAMLDPTLNWFGSVPSKSFESESSSLVNRSAARCLTRAGRNERSGLSTGSRNWKRAVPFGNGAKTRTRSCGAFIEL